MAKTYQVSEEFIKEAHSAACPDWKSKIEKQFPEAFVDLTLEVGVWYKSNRNDSLFCVTDISENEGTRGDCKAFGFNFDGKWVDEKWGFASYRNYDNWNIRATHQEIEEALVAEAKRRGLVPNIFIQSIWCPDPKMSPYPTPEDYVFYEEDNTLILDSTNRALTIFKNGVWAKPCDAPTQQEIDRVLNHLNRKQK